MVEHACMSAALLHGGDEDGRIEGRFEDEEDGFDEGFEDEEDGFDEEAGCDDGMSDEVGVDDGIVSGIVLVQTVIILWLHPVRCVQPLLISSSVQSLPPAA